VPFTYTPPPKQVLEGYGQTESAAAATLTAYGDQSSTGHVGGPLANNEVKLVSVPEMDYLVTDEYHGRVVEEDGTVTSEGIPCMGRGEICYRGANIFLGYFKNPEKTAEAKDEDGWLHSGDIGMFTPEGNLKIVDRKKNIFKLSQVGRARRVYVSPLSYSHLHTGRVRRRGEG
jgi:long-chain acyl-CoA synthetase